MKTPLTDQAAQERLDAAFREGHPLTPTEAADESLRLYQRLFDELAAEPPLSLPAGFAAGVVAEWQRRRAVRSERRAYALFVAGVVGLLALAWGAGALFRIDDFAAAWKAVSRYAGPVGFALGLLVIVQAADYLLVKRRQRIFS